MKRRGPVAEGAASGALVLFLVLLPSLAWGPLARVIQDGAVFLLMPALTLLMAPGAFLGFIAARAFPDRRSAWRFSAGLFLGASLVASVLLWAGGGELDLARRLLQALFGGPFLAGFWIWVGSFLGLALGYGRREDRGQAPASEFQRSA